RPLAATRLSERRRRLWLVTSAVLSAVAIDLIFTLWLMHDERVAYAHGRVTEAQISNVKIRKRASATWYEIDCQFKDQSQVPREAHVRVYAEHHVLPMKLPM